MGILDAKIAIIRAGVYGEEIRTAIYEAFDMLDDEELLGKLDNVPTAEEISSMIANAIAGTGIESIGLGLKGILGNGAQLNRYATSNDGNYTGIYVLGPSRTYSNLPSSFPANTNGILVNINTNDDENIGLDAFVQILYPIGQSFNGKYWVRTDTDEGWKEVGGGTGSGSKGNLPNNTNVNTFWNVNDEGIYRVNESFSYTGLPSGFDSSKAAIFKNYVFTGSNGSVNYKIQELSCVDGSKSWIRGKAMSSNFSQSDWSEVTGSGSGETVSPQDIQDAVNAYLTLHGVESEIATAVSDYITVHGVGLTEARANELIASALSGVESEIATAVSGYITAARANELIASALSGLTDKTFSDIADLNSAVQKYKSITSGLTQAEITLINNAYNTYAGYTGNNASAKPAVADGILGLAAFQYAKNASNPIRSDSDVQAAATAFVGSSTDKADISGDVAAYKQLPNDTAKAAVADGIIGLAAFKRTEWFPTPQMYGAKADGSTDDRLAIQAAINANKGKSLYFPAGTYRISDTLYIKGSNDEYTDIIMDPSACIKATTTWGGSTAKQGGYMIEIGTRTPYSITYSKARKKIFMGGVIDSTARGDFNTYGYVSGLMTVFPDVTDFDISGTVFMATNTATGFALGDNNWYDSKGNLSTDAYVHHITLIKYSWNSAGDVNGNQNRASGLSIHTSDNNFENIRVYYFKRNVKITRGGGNYFSDIHTLGPSRSTWANDTSGFFLEHKTSITLDKCYVDADNHFLYVADEAAGSRIRVSQCQHYQYGGSNGADRTMTAFYLGSANYAATGSTEGIGEVTNLYVNQFDMVPNSKSDSISTDVGRHQGIAVSSSTGSGEYFANQVHNFNMVLNGIRILSPYKLRAGDILRGAMGGEKGSVLFKKTTLAQNASTNKSLWYKLCAIPVANGSAGKIYYRVKFCLDGCYFSFNLAIYQSGTNSLTTGTTPGKVETDLAATFSNQFEIVFQRALSTNSQPDPTAPYAYYMWIRMINAFNASNAYASRMIDKIIFDSATAITPAACQTSGEGFNNFISSASVPSNLSTINSNKYGILIKCNDNSVSYLSAQPT